MAILKTNDELTNVLNFSTPLATVARLYEAAQRLFPDFSLNLGARLQGELTTYDQFRQLYKVPFFTYTFPTVIDWVDGSYQEELNKKLKAVYKSQPETGKQVSSLIGHAVTDKLKQLEE